MSKRQPRPVRLPPGLVRHLLRRRFVWTPQAREAVARELARLACAQYGHRRENVGIEQVCRRCGDVTR